jgi:hypothetical protein
MMKNLNSWFEIDEKEYMWYILKGYTITSVSGDTWVVWKMDGKLHRTDGPAVIDSDGTQVWYLDGKVHRTDGPAAIDSDGTQAWYLDNKLHRTDGPAFIRADGSQWWYLDGKRYTEKEFNAEKSKLSDLT